MRFTLTKMLIAVAMVALACAGLMYHSSGWASVVVTATLVLFGWELLRSLGRSPQERAFGIGFAVVGCAYLLLATSPLFDSLRQSLATNYSLALAARAGGAPDLPLNVYFPVYAPPVAYPAVPVPAPSTPPSTAVRSVPRRVIETRMSDEGVPVSVERIVTEQTLVEVPTTGEEDPRESTTYASEDDAAASSSEARLRPIPAPAYAAPSTSVYPSAPYRPPAPLAMPLESIIQMGMASGNSTPLCRFFLIGHCVWSWLFGLGGGWLAAHMITRRTTPLPSAS